MQTISLWEKVDWLSPIIGLTKGSQLLRRPESMRISLVINTSIGLTLYLVKIKS